MLCCVMPLAAGALPPDVRNDREVSHNRVCVAPVRESLYRRCRHLLAKIGPVAEHPFLSHRCKECKLARLQPRITNGRFCYLLRWISGGTEASGTGPGGHGPCHLGIAVTGVDDQRLLAAGDCHYRE